MVVVVLAVTLLFVVVGSQARGSNPPPPLLPNLVATPPEEVEFETSNNDGDLSKTPEEARLLLRFNGYLHNDGSGALDMQGSRAEPKFSPAAEPTARMEVERRETELREFSEGKRSEEEPRYELSEKTEQELSSPRMDVFQRLYTEAGKPPVPPEQTQKYNKGNEIYLKRNNEEVASSAEMLFVNADGHHHWHLQHVAKYSLWNAAKTAEVAPAQKVGFCLEDSEHVEASKGPPGAVYSDDVAPYRDFCQRYKPYTTSVYEGISPGWRDDYEYRLGFQWVDVSDVLPGEYWLREEVNPEGKILEEDRGEKAAYATEPTIVSGFDALPQAVSTPVGEPVTITATSTRWEREYEPIGRPDYAIVSQPRHGTLTPISRTGQVTYTPEAGYVGPDSYTFSASDPNSEFPRNPEVATVSIAVGTPAPSVAISGAPAEMIAGTSVQLSALLSNDSPGVTWSASSGSITSGGLYTAPAEPPIGGAVVIAARGAGGAEDRVMVLIRPAPIAQDNSAPPQSSAPSTPGATPCLAVRQIRLPSAHPLSTRSDADRASIDHDDESEQGRPRPSQRLYRSSPARDMRGQDAGRSELHLQADARQADTAEHADHDRRKPEDRRQGAEQHRPAAPVPQMKMNMGGPPTKHATQVATRALGHDASSWRFWCSPSMEM